MPSGLNLYDINLSSFDNETWRVFMYIYTRRRTISHGFIASVFVVPSFLVVYTLVMYYEYYTV